MFFNDISNEWVWNGYAAENWPLWVLLKVKSWILDLGYAGWAFWSSFATVVTIRFNIGQCLAKSWSFRQLLCSSENFFSSAQCAIMTLKIVATETLNILNSYGIRSFQQTRANGLTMLKYWQDEDFYDTQKSRAPHLHTISLKAKNGKK